MPDLSKSFVVRSTGHARASSQTHRFRKVHLVRADYDSLQSVRLRGFKSKVAKVDHGLARDPQTSQGKMATRPCCHK